MDTKTGRCGCGALQYAFTGKPLNAVFCYCKACQIHTGSDKFFGMWIPKGNFGFTQGTPAIYNRKGFSGRDVKHMFCEQCGVSVCGEVTVGNFYSVGVSTLDKQDDISPSMAIYTGSAPSWAVFPAGVPRFARLPPNIGG